MTFAPGPRLRVGRCGCLAIALDEGRVLVAGGMSGFEGLASTELLERRPEGDGHDDAAPAPAPAPEGEAPPL